MNRHKLSSNNMLFPYNTSFDDQSEMRDILGYHLLDDIKFPKKTYFSLHIEWGADDLPPGYDLYVLSFHLEQINHDWIEKQSKLIKTRIIILADFNDYQYIWPENVYYVRWIYWHIALDQMMQRFNGEIRKQIKYKASAFCNRITQSKLVVTTALLEYLDNHDTLVSLSDKIEPKNVHFFQSSGNHCVDLMTEIFKSKYQGIKIKIDDFTEKINYQDYTANPYVHAYQNAALHFTNESFHYSQMQYGEKICVLPGPHLTEKTFKCILGATPFISVGQFDVYRTLEELGLVFDYGIDLSFDQDPGNLSRLESIVNLIKTIKNISAEDLHLRAKDSSDHNRQLVLDNVFYNHCEMKNIDSIEKIKDLF